VLTSQARVATLVGERSEWSEWFGSGSGSGSWSQQHIINTTSHHHNILTEAGAVGGTDGIMVGSTIFCLGQKIDTVEEGWIMGLRV
jgi:hypothetical protein